jgi:probable rRNA maturation factor
MISFFYETDFKIKQSKTWKEKIQEVVKAENHSVEEVNYIFCDDAYLLQINKDFLQHDYYTDVIGFQYSESGPLVGDIYISVERIEENAQTNQVSFENELARVMIHGILHFMGYKDKRPEDEQKMREGEEKYLPIFTK